MHQSIRAFEEKEEWKRQAEQEKKKQKVKREELQRKKKEKVQETLTKQRNMQEPGRGKHKS